MSGSLLLDGNSLIHRAFHALPPLTVRRTGEPVGAVYGFCRMFFRVLKDFPPSSWALAFDLPTPTFRHQAFREYKAHRPPSPPDLKIQFERIREIANLINIPIFEVPGFEADDILGTLACNLSKQGQDSVIVSGDKDLLQLVSPQVRVLLWGKKAILLDEEEVRQKYGVMPCQIPDFKGLSGDPSDNIPGAISEKTAINLLTSFQNIEGIYDNLWAIPQKLYQILKQKEKQVHEGKELATICASVPLEFVPDDLRVRKYDRDGLAQLMEDLEFKSLQAKLPDIPSPVLRQP
jgi:DNA polymerase-1